MTFLDGRGSNYDFHYPMHKIDALMKRKQPDHYDMIMEHIWYERDRLNELMPGKKRIISSVRYPYDQFKSFIHYTEMKGRHPQLNQLSKTMESVPGHRFLWVPERLIGKRRQLKEYLDNLNAELALVFITEYFDASLVLMKRIFCWDLMDILYSSLKHGKYKSKKILLNGEKLYKDTRPEEYALYNYFNKTFWARVSRTKPDFMDEVRHFQQVQNKVADFCEPYQEKLSTDPTIIMDDKSKCVVDESKWNKEFSVNVHDCMLMRMHKNAWNSINTIKNFPSLCKGKNLSKKPPRDPHVIQYQEDDGFRFNPDYCNLSSFGGFELPIGVLALNSTYGRDDYFHPPNITWSTIAKANTALWRRRSK